MKLSFIGDIMLGRFVGKKYNEIKYDIVNSALIKEISKSDFVIANLESPITFSMEKATEHLIFQGTLDILQQFKWVNCFSLSNNHINDCGETGMNETVSSLEINKIQYNGLFKDEYIPFLIEKDNTKIAIITCADMMNYEFDKNNNWKTVRIDDTILDETIKKYKKENCFVILYAHVGILFTRFPNPQIRDFIHNKIDTGIDLAITAHPHVLGGMEEYQGKKIFYSLGDFVMDGSSFRRRNSGVLNIEIENNELKSWNIIYATINNELQTNFSSKKNKKKMQKSFDFVTQKLIENSRNYNAFYKKQYRKEILQHSLSTLHFIYREKSILGFFRLLHIRFGAVTGMVKRVFTNRSAMRYDSDAIEHNKQLPIDKL
jgi:poly-gamma-glutamate capsule biosynthesis protein CapA/YwtB (metallophosphatase superfamily)